MFVFNVTVNNGISEEQLMGLKDALNAGVAEIKATIASEAAQHAAKLDEIRNQVVNGDLTAEELSAKLAEIASDIRGIVPDAPSEDPAQPPAGTGE